MKIPQWQQLRAYLFNRRKLDLSQESCYFSIYNDIASFFKKNKITKNLIDDYFQYLTDKNLSPSTKNNRLKVIKHICAYLNCKDLIDDVEYYQVEVPLVDVLTEKEQKEIIKTHPERAWGAQQKRSIAINYRYDVIIECLLRTGLRYGELASLQWEDFKGDCFYIKNTKTNVARIVDISQSLSRHILKLPKNNNPYVFGGTQGKINKENINKELKLRCDKLKITKKITCHTLRHTFITTELRRGVPIEKVSKFVGHGDIQTTMRYTHLLRDDYKEILIKHPLETKEIDRDFIVQESRKFIDMYRDTKYGKQLEEWQEMLLKSI